MTSELHFRPVSVESNKMRKDKDLNSDELGKLWGVDAKRTLLEWSYRIYEVDAAMDNPTSFARYLFSKFMEHVDEKELAFGDKSNFTNITEAYENGHITLRRWTDSVQSMVEHVPLNIHPVIKIDPEVKHHLTNVLANKINRR